MSICVIANPMAAGGKAAGAWRAAYERVFGKGTKPEIRLTTRPRHATELTRQAILDGFDTVLVVGGDGTLNEVVNGFFDDEGNLIGEETALAVVPAGTGGDFARTLGMYAAPPAHIIEHSKSQFVDVGRLICDDGYQQSRRHFINISSFGSSGAITEKVNSSGKILGGKLTYLLGTVLGLMTYKNCRIHLKVDDIYDRVVDANMVAVANARYFGGSMKIAPRAVLNDGLFDVIILEDVGLMDFLKHNPKVYKGEHLGLEGFSMVRGKKIEATAVDRRPCAIECDGELSGKLPVVYEVVPQAIKVWAPWDFAEENCI
ncbi:MAG: diacylglycerol kinase family protein [Myxococcota bacterium]|nr:diacylglycerol kinase family protein [Myxococcota bacterium]